MTTANPNHLDILRTVSEASPEQLYAKLSRALRAVGLDEMAAQAARGEFHDFRSQQVSPRTTVMNALSRERKARVEARDAEGSQAVNMLMHRVSNRHFGLSFVAAPPELISPKIEASAQLDLFLP